MKNEYSSTTACAYLGYITQAIGINLAPLLFSTFATRFNIALSQLTMLIMIGFAIQMAIDACGGKLISTLGYRKSAILAHALCFIGLVLLGFLPFLLQPFAAIVVATSILSMGAGMTEVIISPLVDALPANEKSSRMSLLHSFYSWGHIAVVIITTAFIGVFSQKYWYILPFIWALIPLYNSIAFAKVPIIEESEQASSYKGFVKNKIFPVFFIMIICAGAAEQAIAQWVSYFAEITLGFNKTTGDLLGVCGFALLMAVSRTFYGLFGAKLNLTKYIIFSAIGMTIGLLLLAFSPIPVLSLLAASLCGLCVGIMWPGILSLSSNVFPLGGAKMFSLLALGGDIGCLLGPVIVGFTANVFSLNVGFAISAIFPFVLLIGAFITKKHYKQTPIDSKIDCA